MSELRDARLKRALESAPDAQSRPGARTREAIREQAHGAVRPRAGWWHKPWGGGERMPWTAALATVVMATLVTLLWYDREIPGARPDNAPEAPVSAPAPAPSPAPEASPAPARAAAPPPAPAMPSVRDEAAPAPPPAPAPAPQRRAKAEAPREPPTREPAPAAATKAAPPAAESRAAADAKRAEAARSPSAPAPAPAPAPAAREPAAAAGLASPMRRQAADGATQLRIDSPAGAVDRVLGQSSRLERLLQQAIAGATGNEPLDQPIDTRVELRRNGEAVGLLELAGPQLRWTPANGGAAGTARPDAASLLALREELAQLLQR